METTQADGEDANIPSPRLIPHVVSKHAKETPQKIWGSLPIHPSDCSQGYEDITFARLNYAISRAVSWLQEFIEPLRLRSHEALAYLSPPDSRYVIFAIAAIKAGFQVLFLSPRNSDKAQCSVIQEANCQKFLCSSSMEPRIRKLLHDHAELSEMTQHVVPEQNELLKDEFVADVPYDRTLEQARYEPLVILHTSSTTGIPKTVHLSQGYGLHEDVVQHVPEFKNLDIITRKPFYGHCRMFVAMPLFHAGGVLLTLLKSLYHDIVSVFQPPSAALNAEVFDAILRYGNCNGCVIPPYLLEEMLGEPKFFDTLANLKFVQFGSGPLSTAAGNLLLTRQKNCPHFIGSSECGLYILLELDDPVKDWQYFRFHPWSGVDMRPLGGEGDAHEMFIIRSNAPKVPGMQPVFELFPELDEWPTKDMYVRHPNRSDHWRYIGRNDDVLVLSNGEKINPVDTESRIANAHPSITGALVIGQGQFAPGLLVETRNAEMNDLEALWPIIQAANKDAPGHGKLNKSLILFTSPEKPFLRTPKLSIRRQPTIDLYADEIEEMYNQYMNEIDDAAESNGSSADLTTQSGIEHLVLSSIQSITEWDIAPKLDDDLFMYGMDSLQVSRLTKAIKGALVGSPQHKQVTARMIYSHPTAVSLSEAIFRLLHDSNVSEDANNSKRSSSREVAIEELIEKYSDFNGQPEIGRQPLKGDLESRSGLNILLTGSTGSLGSYILLELLSNPRVGAIFCLNRSKEAEKRQVDIMKAQDVNEATRAQFKNRIRFLHTATLSESQLGLSDSNAFDILRKSGITHIIHNAWPVNFNLSLTSFETHVAGVRALIDFGLSLSDMPEIVFISSLSSVTTLSTKTKVPESISTDSSAPAYMGYGESKYVAERILDNASKATNGTLGTSVLRVGQIAGPVKSSNGIWPAREWLPSLIISSKTVGALPDSLGRMSDIDWIPVDLLAESIAELVLSTKPTANGLSSNSETTVYHVLNPNVVNWSDLLPAIMEQIGVKRTVPLQEWTEIVQQGPEESSTESPNPAKKILRFYKALEANDRDNADGQAGEANGTNGSTNDRQRFHVNNMGRCSTTFRNVGPVQAEWIAAWIAKWF